MSSWWRRRTGGCYATPLIGLSLAGKHIVGVEISTLISLLTQVEVVRARPRRLFEPGSVGAGSVGGGVMPDVFFSYAVAPADYSLLHRLVAAVEREVRVLAELGRYGQPPPVFADNSARPELAETSPVAGPSWALDSAVMVAFYTPEFFCNDTCIREWSLFHERTRWFAQVTGEPSAALVGVPWSLAESELTSLVCEAGPLLGAPRGAVEAAAPQWTLAPQARSSGIPDEAVRALARLVVDGLDSPAPPIAVADSHLIAVPPGCVPPAVAPPAATAVASTRAGGASRRHERPSVRARPPQRGGGVGVVVAAVPRQDQPATRTSRDFYGEDPGDWAPFRPVHDESVFELAQAALQENAIDDSVCYTIMDGRLPAAVSRAKAEGRVMIVLVDPWLAEIGSYRDLLSYLARQVLEDSHFAGIVVVFSETDDETERSASRLRRKLAKSLTAGHGGKVFRFDEVSDAEGLAADLVPVVVRARNARVGRNPAGRSDRSAGPAGVAGPAGEAWVDVRTWSGDGPLPRYGSGTPE